MNNQGIILVGNGISILNKKNGSKIDSFKNIVRFNSFKIKGYEEYTGEKTSIWVTVNNYHEKNINYFDRVIAHSWADHNNCEFYKDLQKKRNIIKFSKNIIKNIPIEYPSTGLISIYYFLNEFDFVYITGFDWWENNKHHYGDNEFRGDLHEPKKEHKIIKDFINEGKIKFY